MRKVKAAVIGTSNLSHGLPIFESIIKQDDIYDFVGYNLPENEKEKFPWIAKIFEKYNELTLEEILENDEIEAVFIEPVEEHITKYAQMAAEHKKHIHMEKPGGFVLSEFEKLIETVKRNGKIFHTGYMYRYNPHIIELMKMIKNGELGEILSVEAQMSGRHMPENRKYIGSLPGGMMYFLGCHLIDLILRIQGKPQRIIPFNKCTCTDGIKCTDYSMAVFEYENGVSFAKTTSAEVGGFIRRQLVVTGTKKTVEIKPLEVNVPGGQYTQTTEYDEAENWNCAGTTKRTEVHDRYDAMVASFAAMVRGDIENPYTYDYELELYKTLLECCGTV